MLRWLWLVPFALAFTPTGAWLIDRGTSSAFSEVHTVFMPFVLAYLVREQLKLDPDSTPQASALGFLFIVPALALLAIDAATQTQMLSAIAFVIALPGLALLLLGARRTRDLLFPLVIAVFIVPIPTGMLAPLYSVLRPFAAVGTTWLVTLIGIPIARVGTQLSVPGLTVEVADNCGGWSTIQAAVITALVLAHFSRSRGRRVTLLLSAIPLALICNVVRVTALVLLSKAYGTDILETQLHPASGVVLFAVVIAGLIAIAGRDAMTPAPASEHRVPISPRYSVALALLASIALIPVVVHANDLLRGDECASPTALVPVEGTSDPGRVEMMQLQYQAVQFREGVVPANGAEPELRFAVVRSYEPRLLYYRGSRRMWPEIEPGGDWQEWIEAGGARLPITRSRISNVRPDQQRDVIASLLVYEGEPVESGWRAQLRAAPRQMFLGGRPMTMFVARTKGKPGQLEAAERRVHQHLSEAWRTYQLVCKR